MEQSRRKTVRELHNKACPCLREAIPIWIMLLKYSYKCVFAGFMGSLEKSWWYTSAFGA